MLVNCDVSWVGTGGDGALLSARPVRKLSSDIS